MSTTDNYRYPGSRPFQDTDLDRSLFFGRDSEKQALLHLVLAEDLVILFAKSGIGKTSLINAGLLQLLRERSFMPLKIRFNTPQISPLKATYATIEDAVRKDGIEYKSGEKKTLWQYFKTVEFWSAEDMLLTPVLILDQFEELFTLHSLEKRRSFITQLADLIRGRIPETLRESSTLEQEFPQSEIPSHVKIIIAMREDFLGQLEEMSQEIPDIFFNRFRLLPLKREQAKQAIENPASIEDEQFGTKSFHYDPGTVKMMLNFLCKQRKRAQVSVTDEVEPFQLQLLCQHVESIVCKNLEQGFTNIIIYKDDLGGPAGMQQVLQNFYNDQIKRLGSFLNRRRARKLCENGLISGSDRRLSLEEEEIDRRFKISKPLLAELVNNRLLRAEPRVGSVYYELSHDTLVEPIRESQRRRGFRGIKYGIIILFVTLFLSLFLITERMGSYKYYYAKGYNLLHHQGKYNEAIENFNKAIELYPKYAEAYNETGNAFFEQGNYDEAIKHYQKTIQLNPDSVDAHKNLGNAFKKIDKYDEALKQYQKVFQLEASFKLTKQSLENLRNEGIPDEILEGLQPLEDQEITGENTFLDAVEKQIGRDQTVKYKELILKHAQPAPDYIPTYIGYIEEYIKTYNNMGNVFEHQGEYEEAITCYQRAIQISPNKIEYYSRYRDRDDGYNETIKNYFEAYSNLGRVFFHQGKYHEAIDYYRKAIQIAPDKFDKIEAYNNLGRVLLHQGKYSEAIKNYREVLQLEADINNYPHAYNNLGIAFKKQGNYDEAIKNFKNALLFDPEYIDTYKNLGDALVYRGKYTEAIKKYQQALQLDPQDVELYNGLGIAYQRYCNYNKAIKNFQTAILLDPKNTTAYNNLGIVLMHQGKYDETISNFQIALQLDPKLSRSYYNWGEALVLQGKYNEAIERYQQALQLDPTNSYGYKKLGHVLIHQGKYDEAVKQYQQALQLDPTDAYGYYGLGNILVKLERYDGAIKNYQIAMNLDPENLAAKMNFAEICLRAARFEKAFNLAQEVLGEPNISLEGMLAMRLISISSLFFQEKRFTALVELGDYIEYYKSLPEDYERNLKYNESKNFIRKTEKLLETDKTLLLTLIEILEFPTSQVDKKLKRLEALFAEAFEQPIIQIIFPQTRQP